MNITDTKWKLLMIHMAGIHGDTKLVNIWSTMYPHASLISTCPPSYPPIVPLLLASYTPHKGK